MKIGLVMEGGAMRGMYTAGVIDVFMENNITFDGAIGVSAGAAFGCNYKSRQPGRVIRYNKKYCRDKRFASLGSLLFTGNLYGAKFCYQTIPQLLDVFDTETFKKSPMEFYAVGTDVNTGKAVYHKCSTGDFTDIEWLRASASMPVVSQIVNIGKYSLLDGGMSDSIPIRYFQHKGYEKNVIILTRPLGYQKSPNSFMPLIKLLYRKYPLFIKAIQTRHIRYNKTLQYISEQEEKGAVYVIRPSRAITLGAVERDPDKLEEIYQLGRRDAENHIKDIQGYLV